MPFKSKAQMRLFALKERRGELPPGTLKRWHEHTEDPKSLPDKLHKESHMSVLTKLARLSLRGSLPALQVLSLIKSSAVGRGEGFGNTNGIVTARSGLLSPQNLVKGNQQPSVPMAGTMPLGMLAGQQSSTIGQPGFPQQQRGPVVPMSGGQPVMKMSSSSRTKRGG